MEQAAADDPFIGAKVGNYEVKQKLGEGGMGAVYLAIHPRIGKRVALKVLHNEFSTNDDVVSRFFNEAKAVNDIQHPNIVDVIDYGTMASPVGSGSFVYFIMEFLQGDSLAKVVHEQSPLAPERSQAIALQVADALGASHRHGIVHRDLKPDNIMISARRDGRDFVKVLDFGIAKLTGDQPGSRRTRTGIVMGTPAYMSPEQCEGRGFIDHRTDVYALGVVLYEMLTGQVPFRGEGYGEVLVQHMTQAPQRPSTIRGVIPPHLEAVCLKALEKKADLRFASMDEFMSALTDPMNYVESHGGVARFSTYSQMMPAMQGATPTPYPGSAYATPAPGSATGHMAAVAPGGYIGQTPSGIYPAQPAPAAPTSDDLKPAKSSTPKLVGAVLAVAVLGGGGFFAWKATQGGGEKKAEAEKPPVTEPMKAPDPAGEKPAVDAPPVKDLGATPPDAPKQVEIILAFDKAEAGEIFLDGKAVAPAGKSPITFKLDRGDKPVELVLKAKGFEDAKVTVVPKQIVNIDFPPLVAVKAAATKPPKEKKRRPRETSGGIPLITN